MLARLPPLRKATHIGSFSRVYFSGGKNGKQPVVRASPDFSLAQRRQSRVSSQLRHNAKSGHTLGGWRPSCDPWRSPCRMSPTRSHQRDICEIGWPGGRWDGFGTGMPTECLLAYAAGQYLELWRVFRTRSGGGGHLPPAGNAHTDCRHRVAERVQPERLRHDPQPGPAHRLGLTTRTV